MRELLNVLHVMTQGVVLRLDHETVRVEADGKLLARLPLKRLSGVVVFGRVTVTPFLIQRCAEDGRSIVWLDRNGRFKARVEGRTRGNVLLRRAQHIALSNVTSTQDIARQIVASKIQNTRQIVLRAAREAISPIDRGRLSTTGERLARSLAQLKDADELDSIRGCEGDAARCYFETFDCMLTSNGNINPFDGRSRRPPRDPVNAALSFTYALLQAECSSAAESVGLDSQVGFLHALRPGRPGLGLDLMEELRAPIADRLVLTLFNRRQLEEKHFEHMPGGAVLLSEDGRREVLMAYQRRKEVEVRHRVLKQPVPLGLVPHVQARLLARHLRGDLKTYPPFLYR